jgi:hypothetical protein
MAENVQTNHCLFIIDVETTDMIANAASNSIAPGLMALFLQN